MTKSKTINISANGKIYEILPGVLLTDFLNKINLNIDRVVVELNLEALTPNEAKKTKLEDGDSLEIVRIVAGG